MTFHLRFILCVITLTELSILSVPNFAAEPKVKSSDVKIQQWIKDLDASQFKVCDQAQKNLIKQGPGIVLLLMELEFWHLELIIFQAKDISMSRTRRH